MGEPFGIPHEVVGLRLCKIASGDLKLAKPVRFERGHAGVVTVLLRARISGAVGPVGETGSYWADLLNDDGDWIETIALDRKSWNILKRTWMRCRMEPAEALTGQGERDGD